MRRMSKQAEVWRKLPLLAAVCILTGGICYGEEKFPNELNSAVDEPQVVIPENSTRVPIRAASVEIQRSTDPLVKLVYETREAQRRRLLSTADHTPWQMMHGLLGLRQDFLISHNGETVNGLEWIRTGPMYQNEPWFQKTAYGGRAHPFNNPYWFEGHINQFLAILAMCNVPLDTQFGTPQGPITMRDMLKNAQMTANEKEEVTWTLWALSTYLPSDAEWINAKGERWSIERLVRLEVAKKVGGPTSPCGGTHGLFALARARNVYLSTRKPLKGVWLEAEYKIQKYIETARVNQNANGTLSSNFFRGREYKQDFDKRMASCGHVLEFLMMALPDERLKEQWVRRAIEATANDLMANRKAYVSCSPLYHATDALSIYLDRVVPTSQQAALNNPAGTRSISTSKDVPVNMATNSAQNSAAVPGASGPPVTAKVPSPDGPSSATSKVEVSQANGAQKDASKSTTSKANPANVASTTKTEDVRIDQEKPAAQKTGDANPSESPLLKIPLPDPTADVDPETPGSTGAEPGSAPDPMPERKGSGSEAPKSDDTEPGALEPAGMPAESPASPEVPVTVATSVPLSAPAVSDHTGEAETEPGRLPEIVASTAPPQAGATVMNDGVIPLQIPISSNASMADAETSGTGTLEVLTIERKENSILFITSMMPIVASAKAVTKVVAGNAALSSGNSHVVSGENDVTAAGTAEAVSPMLTPKDLAIKADTASRKTAQTSSPASTSESLPKDEKRDTPEPDSRRYGTWKSTPPDRRRAIVVEAQPGA